MRMIERWFPCAEVSEASAGGWGSGNSETSLFTWFAKRPLAQAKAAVVTSLLPWPDDPEEQRRLQTLVRRSLIGEAALCDGRPQGRVRPAGYDEAHAELVAELAKYYPKAATLLDPFSGRAMIPLEAARLGITAWGFDYSPVATLAGILLADYPLRDWSAEPELPFGEPRNPLEERLPADVRTFLNEVGRRYEAAMAPFYPKQEGKQPWGYLWAMTIPCQECGRRFPLTGSLVLRHPLPKKNDPGQSYRIVVDKVTGEFWGEVHTGIPESNPTLVLMSESSYSSKGKSAVCPFCDHPHPKDVHTRLAAEGQDVLLIAADLDDKVGKLFRTPTETERQAAAAAEDALRGEKAFEGGLSAVPDELIPSGNTWTVQPTVYGVKTYGGLCNVRQTLGYVRLCRIISELTIELPRAGLSETYTAALCAYAGAVVVRKLKYSTRGATVLAVRDVSSNRVKINHVFGNSESSISFSYDYFETGLGDGPGTWFSLIDHTVAVLRNQTGRVPGKSARIRRGSALGLPLRSRSIDAVVTDPPYDSMIDYADASDLFYVWLKRALSISHPEFGITVDPNGLQEKSEEIIVKKGGTTVGDHRTKEHYDQQISLAFKEAARIVREDGVLTIVFGHGEYEVWKRLLDAITGAGLYLTGSWPAKTEKGGMAGSANIVTTLTLACRPAPPNRPRGRVSDVDAEVKREVRSRVPLWEAAGLALTDQLMASAGPAMEVAGRYSEVLDRKGDPVDLSRYLLLSRQAVEEAAAIKIDTLPLETFDARTRFALFWTRLFGRTLAPKSEARWQAMASNLRYSDLGGVLVETTGKARGVRLAFAKETRRAIEPESSIIDVALAIATAWNQGLEAAAEVLAASGRDAADTHLWAALTYLSSRLPEADPDRAAWTGLMRARRSLPAVTRTVATRNVPEQRSLQGQLFTEESWGSGGGG